MSTGLIQLIKQASLEAVENNKPADLRFGTVVTEKPLSIRITNQFILPESILIVPENLTDHEVEITIKPDYNWITMDTMNKAPLPETETVEEHSHKFVHKHDIVINNVTQPTKVKNFWIWNGLRVGDKVALLRMQGGQFYYVLDRLPKE